MEIILQLYLLPYNPLKPVICFDERPCFLIGDIVKGIDMSPGQAAKENYSYSKNGSRILLAAIEPLTGKRVVHIRHKRRKVEFAKFMKHLASFYPNAVKILDLQNVLFLNFPYL